MTLRKTLTATAIGLALGLAIAMFCLGEPAAAVGSLNLAILLSVQLLTDRGDAPGSASSAAIPLSPTLGDGTGAQVHDNEGNGERQAA
ncbi:MULTISPECIES: hypothetical protein [Streptomyces]|uniref:Uncharacterized protein n=1 Tax=Streptomyces liliifuscus TaxID=2797636 RepID=A0A7T7RGY4_9ACTN|nr:hypothetical protein [Streptomyces liliifuscus]QQM46257.1 hypothetical protein JEQ17_47170 [Streptomyces liliifuscus]